MESGDWKTFNPDSFERVCRDWQAMREQQKIEKAFTESTNALAATPKVCATEGCGNWILLAVSSENVLEKVRARLVDGHPALERHLCVDGRVLIYQREPACHNQRTVWKKIFG